MNKVQFKEIETKYRAENIELKRFQDACEGMEPLRQVVASGFDHFYCKVKDPSSFCRHRKGPDKNELTFKRKTSPGNNYVRTEYNINMGKGSSIEQVAAFCAEFGYQYNTSIFKNCFVYNFGFYTLVYYVVYDTQLKELGRFVEIEMSEDEVWRSESEAWDELRKIEVQLGRLLPGIKASSRLSESLFEMFKKDS